MQARLRNSVFAGLLMLCAGCGTSGGTGDLTSLSGGPTTIGVRGVPGGTVSVSSDRAVVPGASNVFHVVLSNGMVPTQVRAWMAAAPPGDDPGFQATPAATGAGTYDVSLTVPSPLAVGSRVWVRLTFANGAVIETGSDDFPIGGN
jgi:hypothetical protein